MAKPRNVPPLRADGRTDGRTAGHTHFNSSNNLKMALARFHVDICRCAIVALAGDTDQLQRQNFLLLGRLLARGESGRDRPRTSSDEMKRNEKDGGEFGRVNAAQHSRERRHVCRVTQQHSTQYRAERK